MDLQAIAKHLISGGMKTAEFLTRNSPIRTAPKYYDPKTSNDERLKLLSSQVIGLTGGITSPGEGVAQSITQRVPISKMAFNQDDMARAVGDVLEKRYSKTAFPPLAVQAEHGGYDVMDGLHRIAREILSGNKEMDVITDEKAYRKLLDLAEKGQAASPVVQKSAQYLKDAKGKFAGSSSTSKTAMVDDLVQEARKYKSPEEFVGIQPKLYHGGASDIKNINLSKSNFDKTFYMSDSADYAKSFGGSKSSLNEMTLDPKAKLIDLRKPTTAQIDEITKAIQAESAKPAKYGESFSFYPYSTRDVIQGLKDGKAHFAELPQMKKIIRSLGYDGQITAEVPYAKNIGVWNKDVIKTKSQLTDIWNKANGWIGESPK